MASEAIWRAVPAAIADLPENRGTAIELDGRAIALFRDGGRVYALDDLCPHAGARLSAGRRIGEAVTCPLHGARFDLATGACRSNRVGDVGPVVTHAIDVRGGRVWLRPSASPMARPR